ncbi:MAG: heavy metal-associated domain-containing protein [Candidatus Kapaibacterium sp.]
MKTVKDIALAITIVVIVGILISGCGKNETKNNTSEKDVTKQDTQKNVTENMNQKTEKTEDMKDMVKDTKDNKNAEHTMIKIPSAQCEICEKNLNKALKKVTGVEKYKVDIEAKVIHINYDRNVTTLAKIENAITSAGYDANDKQANPDAYDKLDNCCKKPEDRKKKN